MCGLASWREARLFISWSGLGMSSQYRRGAGGLLWLGRREYGEALLPGCPGFVVINKIEESSDASPPHISFGLIFVTVAIER